MASAHDAIDYVEFTVRDLSVVRTGGRRFQFTDPSGNELGVWSQAPGH